MAPEKSLAEARGRTERSKPRHQQQPDEGDVDLVLNGFKATPELGFSA